MGNFIYPYLAGHFDSGYFSFYDYIFTVLEIDNSVKDKWQWYITTAQMGLIYPLERFCVVSDRPSSIKMLNGRLHSENSPSIEYTDGFAVYSLNGVRMKPEYVLTPANKLDIKTVMEETNTEVRMELIKKIGRERLIAVSDVVDTWGEYKLLDMRKPLMSNQYEPYLYMVNPSTSEIHCEGVGHECKTVEQAIQWSYPDNLRKIPIDEKNGKPFYQQGDVVIWEDGMLTRQKYPVILTYKEAK
jgi:hypothetical protein